MFAFAAPVAGQEPPRSDLVGLFDAGRMVMDRSGDGVADDLAVRIVVPDTPSAAATFAATESR